MPMTISGWTACIYHQYFNQFLSKAFQKSTRSAQQVDFCTIVYLFDAMFRIEMWSNPVKERYFMVFADATDGAIFL